MATRLFCASKADASFLKISLFQRSFSSDIAIICEKVKYINVPVKEVVEFLKCYNVQKGVILHGSSTVEPTGITHHHFSEQMKELLGGENSTDPSKNKTIIKTYKFVGEDESDVVEDIAFEIDPKKGTRVLYEGDVDLSDD